MLKLFGMLRLFQHAKTFSRMVKPFAGCLVFRSVETFVGMLSFVKTVSNVAELCSFGSNAEDAFQLCKTL